MPQVLAEKGATMSTGRPLVAGELAAFVQDDARAKRFVAMWMERPVCDEPHFAPGACYDCQVSVLLALLADREAKLAAANQALGMLQDDIEHGRCCDDYTRLPQCGHPRCCVSEGCEICVEIGEKISALADKLETAEAKLRAVGELRDELLCAAKGPATNQQSQAEHVGYRKTVEKLTAILGSPS